MVNFTDLFTGTRYDDETSYGSGSVSADALSLGKVTSFNPTVTDDKGRLLGIGEGRNDSSYPYGPVNITFQISWDLMGMGSGPARSNSLDFLQYAIGSISGSGTAGSPYLITEADFFGYTSSDMKTFGLWVQSEGGSTDDLDQYTGCFLNSITITAAIDTVVKATATGTASKITSAASITNAYVKDTNKPLMFQQGSFKWGQTPTAVLRVQNFAITVNSNPIPTREIGDGGRFLVDVVAGRRQYDWTVTVRTTDAIATTLRDDLYGQANSFIDGTLDVESEDNNEIELLISEGTSTGNKNYKANLDQCVITNWVKTVTLGNGWVDATFSGWAKDAKSNNFLNYFLAA